MDTVSFLVPSYNHSKYIVQTLDSILSDTYPSKEIVVIDDGSSDSSPVLIKKWIADNPGVQIHFRERGNRGIARTMNELIELSTGKYLRLFSSDDVNLPNSTSLMLDELNRYPNVIAVFGDCKVIDECGNSVAERGISFKRGSIDSYIEDLPRAIITNWAVSGPVIMLNKSHMLKVFEKYDESLLVDDWFLYLNLLSQHGLRFLNIVVAEYRIHGNNTSMVRTSERRILNLKSQLKVSYLLSSHFKGREKIFLSAERAKLLAKIAFLERRIVPLFFWYGVFIIWIFVGAVYTFFSH